MTKKERESKRDSESDFSIRYNIYNNEYKRVAEDTLKGTTKCRAS